MAMGITQALKLQQGPIDALAKLPQQELIKMAQQGRIGAEILPVILNEKAQMIQQAANAQAAAQPRPPSIIEQAMAINAQADAAARPPMMPMQMAMVAPQQQEAGLAGLEVPEDMYGSSQSYAGGGIVAFDDGGWIDQGGGFYTPKSDTGVGPMAGLSDYIRQMQDVYGALPARSELQNLLAEERQYQADYKARAAKTAEENRWQRLLEAGLGIMGGESPYAFTNIGKGAQAAAKGYAEDVKEQAKQEQAARQARLGLAKQEYDIAAGDVSGALKMQEAATERTFKAEEGRLDRLNRLAVANIPAKELQVAAQIRRENPALSYLDSIDQAAKALSPKDTYNATRTAVSAAAKDANAEFNLRATFDPKLQEDMRKAAQGDKDAQARLKAVRDKIQADTFKLYQVEGVDLSSGKIGSSPAADPLGIRK